MRFLKRPFSSFKIVILLNDDRSGLQVLSTVGAFDSKLFRLQVTILLISLISDLLKRITL